MTFIFAFAAAAVAMLVLDAIWLFTMAELLYRPQLGDLLAEPAEDQTHAAFNLLDQGLGHFHASGLQDQVHGS